MTYLGFHFLFILPPIVLLVLRQRPLSAEPRRWLHLLAVLLIALVYTTPWDNYLVWRGVWDYGADRVIGTIGYVPVEEYLFFILQPILTGLWLYLVIERTGADGVAAAVNGRARLTGAALYFAIALIGALLLTTRRGTYMGLILAWAAPVLALQWAYAGHEISRRLRTFALAVAVPTLYLWIADGVAIHLGIWRISSEYTFGFAAGPLPIEEATFFLVTNLLVVQGIMLFRYPPGRRGSTAERSAVGAR